MKKNNNWGNIQIEMPSTMNIKGIDDSIPMKPLSSCDIEYYIPHCSECVNYEACTNCSMYCKKLKRAITARKRASKCKYFQSITTQIHLSVVYDVDTQKLYLERTNLEPQNACRGILKKLKSFLSDFIEPSKP